MLNRLITYKMLNSRLTNDYNGRKNYRIHYLDKYSIYSVAFHLQCDTVYFTLVQHWHSKKTFNIRKLLMIWNYNPNHKEF